ncbi:hypothetical protein HNY73_005524 [Argiope bruennichi]|uniref:Uncharacterized protein n=1 Tax=Argiope bruennichi TaxID=94029 RepID=A0A8T0FM75_ARGBR|nr:hypothetical protein HNY73_005524 [Argiope bruennichi]
MGEKNMVNRRKLSHADVPKLIETSGNEEEVSEYENHTRDEIESESSGSDFDTNIQKIIYKGRFSPRIVK